MDNVEKKNGRPKREFDQAVFEELCAHFCTVKEIAAIFRTDIRILDRWTRETYELSLLEARDMFSADGKISLRRKQMKLAEKDSKMSIFLGKNYLSQVDKKEIKASGEITTKHDFSKYNTDQIRKILNGEMDVEEDEFEDQNE